MTTATVTTDIHIGPFTIPSNGQNMIMNNYASRNKISVELVIPEPMKSNSLATLQWIHEERKLSKVILCSIHQLPKNIKNFDILLKNMINVEFHFALEGVKGQGNEFLKSIYKEAEIFMKTKIIDSKNTTWLDLNKIYTDEEK
tara:strand:+ start:1169 stop:1597 length:429 start_codon:yes stop_codon:yes gene_type:complete